MDVLKRVVLVLALGVLAALGVVALRADRMPTPPLPDLLELHWGAKEPLKTHTVQRVTDVDAELEDGGG